MKKITLLFLTMVTAVSMSFAVNGTVSGQVTNMPASLYPPGLLVHIYFYNNTVPSPGAMIFNDTVRTDSLGYYYYSYNFATTATSGLVYAEITNCNSVKVGDSTFWNTTTAQNPVINPNYCWSSSSCNAAFAASASGLTASFLNNSTPLLGRITHSWSFGDGTFSNTISPSHTYSAAGTYAVCLYMYDTLTACSDSYCDSITVGTTPPAGKVISGNITANSLPSGDAIVYLITADSNNFLTAVDSQVVGNIIGTTYSFNVTQGQYFVKAALLASNPNYTSYLPTYYNNSLSWGSATAVNVGGSSVTGVNINLIQGLNVGGPAFIGGLVSLGANKAAGPGDPYKGAIVILTDDQGNGVAYDITDANGEYSFSNLAYGTYKLYVDMLNKTSVERTVVLSADNEKEEGLTFIIGQSDISTGINQLSNVAMNGLYPNPASESVNLTIDAKVSTTAQLVITDMLGKEVMNSQLNLGSGKQLINLNISTLNEGIYFVNIISDNDVKTQKLVKH